MLHFLENHDEQRIASQFFAGDAFKAMPALVVSATIDEGPMMFYFGQELGERGEGVEGFSGEDGRTTIFDYWCVPSQKRWIEGKFGVDSLSDDQRTLREFYKTLLHIARDNPAIAEGHCIEKTSVVQSPNSTRLIDAFVRAKGDEKLLVICSFMSQPNQIEIPVSDVLIRLPQRDSVKTYTVKDLLGQNVESEVVERKLRLALPAYGAYILKIEEH
jgi:hypothetical protein